MVHRRHAPPGFRLSATSRLGRASVALATAALLFTPAHVSLVAASDNRDEPCGVRPLDVVVVVDKSTSMDGTEGAKTRLGWAKSAATSLVNDLDGHGGVGSRHHVGVVSYSDSTAVDVALGSASASDVNAAIDGLHASGNTHFKQGMAKGADAMSAGKRGSVGGLDVDHVIIFLSDGRPNPDTAAYRPDAGDISSFQAAADEVFSVAVGQGGSGASQVDLVLMQALAKGGSGHYYHVTSGDQLPDIFALIYQSIACEPGIQVAKSANHTELPAGGGDVTYGYKVTNTGNVGLSNVDVSDDTCSPVAFGDGDEGSDGVLGVSETWTYSCSMTLTESTTNVATASGTFRDATVSDKDDLTVTVAKPVPTETAPVPTETAPVPTETAPVPTETAPVPTETAPVPTETAPVPTETAPVPTETAPVPTPTASSTATADPTATPRPTGTVEAETGTPRPTAKPGVTPPPTDAGSTGTPGTGTFTLVLGLLAAIALVATLTPASLRRRIRSDR